VQTVVDAERGLRLLAARPDVDPRRLGFVGHSFGASVGAVLAATHRLRAAVLTSGSATVTGWFTAFPNALPAGVDLARYVRAMAPLDPIHYIGAAAPTRLLLQNGRQDNNFPAEQTAAFLAAASRPRTQLWYDAGHDLDPVAQRDRDQWLQQQLAPSR